MKKLKYLVLGAVLATLLGSCSHDPVYPSIGSLYVSTDPVGAEILIDGQTKNRSTPAKIDGITVGWHTVTLCYYRCKEWKQQVEIKPGQTRNLSVKMITISPSIVQRYQLNSNGVGLAYDIDSRKIYIANRSTPHLSELFLGDPMILSKRDIFIGSEQFAVTVSSKSNRGYALLSRDSLAVFELSSGTLLGKIPPVSHPGIKHMAFSFDGNYLYVANSADSSISVYHAGPDTIIKTIKLAGSPSEVTSNSAGDKLYVLFGQERRLAMIDIYSGIQQLPSITTGNAPMGMFWDMNYQTMGVCNSVDKTVMLMNPENLAITLSPKMNYGTVVPRACLSSRDSYLWVIGSYYFIAEQPVNYGVLTLYYTPTWNAVGHYTLGIEPWDMVQSGDGRYLYILVKLSKEVVVFRTDLMD